MKETPEVPVTPAGLRKKALLTPHNIALILIWLLSTISLIVMLANGVRHTGQYGDARNIIQVVYVLTLFWYLIRTGPSVSELPVIDPPLLPRWSIGRYLPAILIALLLVAEFTGQFTDILMLLMILATVWILIAWWREIRLSAILLGLTLTIIALLAGFPLYQNQAMGEALFILLLVFVAPMFVAGGLLSQHTGLIGSQLYFRRIKGAMTSVLWGCLLFVPLGLANAAAGSPGSWMNWVDRWWIPLTQPWFSAIVEEAWFRLLLVSLCYYLLRPAFSKRPAIAIIGAVFFSAITFGLGHGGTILENLLMTGLLYGLPLAVIFARRDWEHAVGAHYMINLIPTLILFLEI